jgi:hypothetical protein
MALNHGQQRAMRDLIKRNAFMRYVGYTLLDHKRKKGIKRELQN